MPVSLGPARERKAWHQHLAANPGGTLDTLSLAYTLIPVINKL